MHEFVILISLTNKRQKHIFFLKFLTHVWCLSCSVSAPLSIIMIISDHSIPIKLSIKEQGVVGGNIFKAKIMNETKPMIDSFYHYMFNIIMCFKFFIRKFMKIVEIEIMVL